MAHLILILAISILIGQFMSGWSESAEARRRAKREREEEEKRRAKEPTMAQLLDQWEEEREWSDREQPKLWDEEPELWSAVGSICSLDVLHGVEPDYEDQRILVYWDALLDDRRFDQGLPPLSGATFSKNDINKMRAEYNCPRKQESPA
jgi:hypothetical protein